MTIKRGMMFTTHQGRALATRGPGDTVDLSMGEIIKMLQSPNLTDDDVWFYTCMGTNLSMVTGEPFEVVPVQGSLFGDDR